MTEANKETSKMSETAVSETEATFSGTKRETIQVVYYYRVVTGRGISAKEALRDLEAGVFVQVEGRTFTPVGGATVLFDEGEQVWVACQAFIMYDDKELEE